jgi:hypothetical protein
MLFLKSLRVGVIAVVMVGLWLGTVNGQTPESNSPRTSWGAPDLQGVWDFRTITPLERPDSLTGQEFLTEEEAAAYAEGQSRRQNRDLIDSAQGGLNYAAEADGGVVPYNEFWYDRGTSVISSRRTSLIIDPPDGRLPAFTPEAQRSADARREIGREEQRGRPQTSSYVDRGPSDRCIQHAKAGPPIHPGAYNNNMQLFQTPDHIAILNEQIHDVRIISVDGPAHLGRPVRLWQGDSRAHWDGETLIVETTNFNGKHDQVGRPGVNSGDRLSLIERFTRLDAETLVYEYTVTDPETWVSPWTAQVPMKKNLDMLYEYACHEGNYSMATILRGARLEEKAAEEAAR